MTEPMPNDITQSVPAHILQFVPPTGTAICDRGSVVGMVYDDGKKAWLLDYPCRINGKATHIKSQVRGPKRATQAEAMRQWLDMETRAKDPAGSITVNTMVDNYISSHPKIKPNISVTIEYIRSELGNVKRRDIEAKFAEWIESQRGRKKRVWRVVDGKRTLCETDKTISDSTIRLYIVYGKAIFGAAVGRIRAGKPGRRVRPITPDEMERIEAVIKADYPWFWDAFDYARKNPIRPGDQFRLSQKNVRRGSTNAVYTAGKTRTPAFPVPWPEHEHLLHHDGELFSRPEGQAVRPRWREAHAKELCGDSRYYGYVWEQIRKKAGCEDIQWKDLRHHAVAWMRTHGVEDWRIIKAAGWAGPAMLKQYDPDNEHLIFAYDKETTKKRSADVAPEVAPNKKSESQNHDL